MYVHTYTRSHIHTCTHIILYIYFDMRSWLVEFILATLTVLSNQCFQHNCFNLSDWISIHIFFFSFLPPPLFGIYCFHWKVGNKHQWWWHYEPHKNLPWVLTSGECQPPSGGKCSQDSLPPLFWWTAKRQEKPKRFPFVYHHDFFFHVFFFFSLPPTISIFLSRAPQVSLAVRVRKRWSASLAPMHISCGSLMLFFAERHHEAVQTWYTTHHKQLGRLLKYTSQENAPSRRIQLKM